MRVHRHARAARIGLAFLLMMQILTLGMSVVPAQAMLAPADPAATEEAATNQRLQDVQKVQGVLEMKVIRQRLEDLGFNADEIASRLGVLSDEQLHHFATQIDSLEMGGFHGVDDLLHLILTIAFIVLIVVVILILI